MPSSALCIVWIDTMNEAKGTAMTGLYAALFLGLLGASACLASDIVRACERRDESEVLDHMELMD